MESKSTTLETKVLPARVVLNDPLLKLHLHDRNADADLWVDPEPDKRVQIVVRRVRNGDLMSGMQAQVERQISQYIMHMGLYDLKTNYVYHFNNDLSTLGQAHTARLVRTSLAQFVGGYGSDRQSLRGKFFYVHTGLSAEDEEAALKRCEDLLSKGGLVTSESGQKMHYDPMHWNCQHLAFYLLYGHKQYKGQAGRAASAAMGHFVQQARSSNKLHPALAGFLNDPAVLKSLSDVLAQHQPSTST